MPRAEAVRLVYRCRLGSCDAKTRFPDGVPLRIDLAPVHEHLVVEMRARRNARRSDIADDVAPVDPSAVRQRRGEAQEMAIGGLDIHGMAKANVVAVVAAIAEVLDHPIGR